MTTQPTALTGIQPSGLPHLGNFYGALLPVRRLAETHRLRVFIADAHALNASGGDTIHDATDQLVRLLIALGIADHGVIYRQSDVPETFELAMLLANVTGKGLLNRSHAYRTAVERNLELGRPEDDGVNMGLFLYPLLMAADILIGSADVVPVGEDQRSHVEMARDIAGSFNARYGATFRVPEGVIAEQVAVVPGTDGRKMSKSYGNVLPLLATDAELAAIVRRIPTTSLPPEEPKDPDGDTLFRLYALVADPADVADVRELYLRGGLGYGDMKSRLSSALAGSVGELRDRALAVPDAEVGSVLEAGAAEMRATAGPLLARVKQAMGVRSQYS